MITAVLNYLLAGATFIIYCFLFLLDVPLRARKKAKKFVRKYGIQTGTEPREKPATTPKWTFARVAR